MHLVSKAATVTCS